MSGWRRRRASDWSLFMRNEKKRLKWKRWEGSKREIEIGKAGKDEESSWSRSESQRKERLYPTTYNVPRIYYYWNRNCTMCFTLFKTHFIHPWYNNGLESGVWNGIKEKWNSESLEHIRCNHLSPFTTLTPRKWIKYKIPLNDINKNCLPSSPYPPMVLCVIV